MGGVPVVQLENPIEFSKHSGNGLGFDGSGQVVILSSNDQQLNMMVGRDEQQFGNVFGVMGVSSDAELDGSPMPIDPLNQFGGEKNEELEDLGLGDIMGEARHCNPTSGAGQNVENVDLQEIQLNFKDDEGEEDGQLQSQDFNYEANPY
uniref:Uncharacterized protein n=1 Tax=Strombidium rassoulzadegani TaxID=1082188 RepID=A0A7S3CSF7_9SPIT|mmetsp:Transcript_6040/g.10252  ORF Transcript_6040/g.10252 Transcript_6040/m.10252 type:complete len:149 (+) Transcript_6040:247-693(+)